MQTFPVRRQKLQQEVKTQLILPWILIPCLFLDSDSESGPHETCFNSFLDSWQSAVNVFLRPYS